MKTTTIASAIILACALSGCAATYMFEGKKYQSSAEFHSAVAAYHARANAAVTPLPVPITFKKLIFGIPSINAMNEASSRAFTTMQGTPPTGIAKEIITNLNTSGYNGGHAFYDGVAKRNIYSSAQLIELDSMNGSLAPSESVDVIYYIEPIKGSGQWYYASQKFGKQIFSFDRSSTDASGKMMAFIEAVQMQAIRE